MRHRSRHAARLALARLDRSPLPLADPVRLELEREIIDCLIYWQRRSRLHMVPRRTLSVVSAP